MADAPRITVDELKRRMDAGEDFTLIDVLAHLDGLNLSRAWMLEGIAAGLPKGDKRPPMIVAAAEQYKSAGLAAVTGRHYEGGHWLGSFAVYFVTRRGISLK